MTQRKTGTKAVIRESLLCFEEGLIGFPGHKTFRLVESSDYDPFCRLESTAIDPVGFFALNPQLFYSGYGASIPDAEWKALGVRSFGDKLILIICVIGPTISASTGNFRAPILVNRSKMAGRQIILTDKGLESRQPLFET